MQRYTHTHTQRRKKEREGKRKKKMELHLSSSPRFTIKLHEHGFKKTVFTIKQPYDQNLEL